MISLYTLKSKYTLIRLAIGVNLFDILEVSFSNWINHISSGPVSILIALAAAVGVSFKTNLTKCDYLCRPRITDNYGPDSGGTVQYMVTHTRNSHR